VGKTSLINHFLTESFDINIGKSMGVDVSSKNIIINGLKINLQIWDFVGDIRFRNLLLNYARGSYGGIFMYDISNQSSIKSIDSWLNLFQEKLPRWKGQIPIIVVGGKSDLSEEKVVTIQDAVNFSKNQKIFDYMECSSKTGINVDKVFNELTIEIMKRLDVQ